MSDQQPQPTSDETGTLGAGPAAPDAPAPVTAAAEVEAARLAPDQESPKPDAPKVDAVKMEAPKVEAPKAEVPKIDSPTVDAVKPETPRFPGNVTIMSPGERVGADAKAAPAEGSTGKRRFGAMAAVVALATVAGALGGALATAGIGKLMAGDSAQASAQVSAADSALEALKTAGMTVTELPPAEMAKLREKVKPVIEKYTASVGDATVKELMAEIAKVRK